MKLQEAVESKKAFRRDPAGRVIEIAESCGLRFFRFQKQMAGQTKETVVFSPDDFDMSWSVIEEKKEPTSMDRALAACDALRDAIKELAGKSS